jgi:hypothetical protein
MTHRTPVEIHTIKQRRRLVGHVIEWTPRGALLPRRRKVRAVEGRNIDVDGDWQWVPAMHNVHLIEQEN